MNSPEATSKTDPGAANYVGMVTLFMYAPIVPGEHGEHEQGQQGREFRFNITLLVRRLVAATKFDPDRITVTVVPVGVGKDQPDAEVSVGKIEIRLVQD